MQMISTMQIGSSGTLSYADDIKDVLLLLSDAFHKNVSKAASRAQSQLDDKNLIQ